MIISMQEWLTVVHNQNAVVHIVSMQEWLTVVRIVSMQEWLHNKRLTVVHQRVGRWRRHA